MTTENPDSPQASLFQAAGRLFNDGSYQSVTIEELITAAGVSRTVFDALFETKEDLIVAYLEDRDRMLRGYFFTEVTKRGHDDPRATLLALFDVLGEWFRDESFYGCIFSNACSEYGQGDHPVHQVAARHKKRFRDFILARVEEIGFDDPEQKADEITFLMEGAIITAHIRRDARTAQSARKAAEVLLGGT